MARPARLLRLTNRWRARRDARRKAQRPLADPERESLATRAFPFRSVAPADYVAEHGADMIGFTYDEARYGDPELDAWLIEVGRLLRLGR
jgi:hypothetical protein